MTDGDVGPDRIGSVHEVSPYNAAAVRGPRGIWNEEALPVVEWEDAAHRVVLPESLQHGMGVPESVARWAQSKRSEVLTAHQRDAAVIESLADHLDTWRYFGKDRSTDGGWRVLFEIHGRWYTAVIARDTQGSLNVVTVFGSSKRRFVGNRLEGLVDVVER